MAQKRYLDTIYPVAYVAKCFGVCPYDIKSTESSTEIFRSSSRTVVYSYVFLVCSLLCQALASQWSSSATLEIDASLWYLAARIVISGLLHFSFLLKRNSVCELYQKVSRLGIGLSKYYIAFPATVFLFLLFLSILEPILFKLTFTQYLWFTITNMGPPIVTIYTCFMYGCQVTVLKKGIQNLNLKLVKYTNSPSNYGVSLRPAISYYFLLSSICNDLNKVFGHQMFLTSSMACIDVTYSLFVTCVPKMPFEMFTCLSYAVLGLTPEVSIMFACQQVESSMEETKALSMALLMQTELPRKTKKEAQELNLLLNQLPMSFSAGGLFILNGQQLSAAISTYITYTIILIQNIRK